MQHEQVKPSMHVEVGLYRPVDPDTMLPVFVWDCEWEPVYDQQNPDAGKWVASDIELANPDNDPGHMRTSGLWQCLMQHQEDMAEIYGVCSMDPAKGGLPELRAYSKAGFNRLFHRAGQWWEAFEEGEIPGPETPQDAVGLYMKTFSRNFKEPCINMFGRSHQAPQ